MIYRLEDIEAKVDQLRVDGLQRGERTGFKCLDELYSVKQGSYTILLGSPTHGKSEIIFELVMNQALEYGKKAVIFSPETGSVEEVFMELIHKYQRQTAYLTSGFGSEDREYFAAKNFVKEHFYVVDSDESSYSLPEIFEAVDLIELQFGITFSIIVAEPYNELKHDMKDYGGRQDIYIEDFISGARRYCKLKGKHFFLSLHPGVQGLVTDPNTKITYYPMPKAREAAGGQAMFRKAMSWINIWRPPFGMIDPATNEPYKENEVILIVEKSKPKGVGKKGMCKLYFDWQRNRYYEMNEGRQMYAFDHEKESPPYRQASLLPSEEFENAPF